jgi:hypothetical protein
MQPWALSVPGEKSRGKSKFGEEYQKGQTSENNFDPSPKVLLQSAKSGCKNYISLMWQAKEYLRT